MKKVKNITLVLLLVVTMCFISFKNVDAIELTPKEIISLSNETITADGESFTSPRPAFILGKYVFFDSISLANIAEVYEANAIGNKFVIYFVEDGEWSYYITNTAINATDLPANFDIIKAVNVSPTNATYAETAGGEKETGTSDYTFEYVVTYKDANAEETVNAVYGDVITLAEPSNYAGHTFNGWSDGEKTYQVGDKYKVTGPVTFTAVWKVNAYKVVFVAPTGYSNPTKIVDNYGTSFVLPNLKASEIESNGQDTTHYDLVWYSDDSYTTVYGVYGAKDSDGNDVESTITKDTTLYARWDAKPYTITFNANYVAEGATEAATTTQTLTYYVATALADNTLTKEGYSFGGWATSAELATNGTVAYANKASYTATEAATLYAIWKPIESNLTLDAQNGTLPSVATIKYDDTYNVALSYVPSYTGHTFTGWYTAPTGGNKVEKTDKVTIKEDTTLYAHWTTDTYTVTYKANGETINETLTDGTKTHGVDLTLSAAVTSTDVSKSFKEWNTSADGNGTSYAAGAAYSTDSAVTLYAIWETTTYAVTFDANTTDNTVASMPANTTKTYNVDLALSTTVPTRTGYTFLGWSTNNAATVADTGYAVADITSGITYTTNANLSLYAVWKADTETVTLYNVVSGAAEGTAFATNTVDYGSTFTFPTDLKKVGYELEGWYTDSNCTIKVNTASVSITNDVDYYANWVVSDKIPYTVRIYQENLGGEYELVSSKVYYGTGNTSTTAATELGNEGVTYTGFNRLAITEGTIALDGSTVVDVKYDRETYTVTYAKSSSKVKGTIEAVSGKYGSTINLANSGYILAGYTLTSWADENNNSYDLGSTYTITGDVTLSTKWTANTYNLTLDAQNGQSTTTTTVTYNGTYSTALANNPVFEGHTFAGWYTASTGGTQIKKTTKVTITKDTTLYAQWNTDTYAVTYDANSETINEVLTNGTKTYGVDLTLSTIVPTTNTGKTFKEWNTSEDGTGTSYAAGANYTANAAVTLYAIWETTTYTVTFDENYVAAGTTAAATTTQTKTYNVDLELSKTMPARTGYTFLGWSTNATATSADAGYAVDDITAGITYTTDAALTLYAVWQPESYSIKFYVGDTIEDLVQPANRTVKHGETFGDLSSGGLYTATDLGYTGNDYTLTWYADSNFENEVTASTSVDGTITTLYAKWTPVTA